MRRVWVRKPFAATTVTARARQRIGCFPTLPGFAGQRACDISPVRGEVAGRGVEMGLAAVFVDRVEEDPATLASWGEEGIGESALCEAVIAAACRRS